MPTLRQLDYLAAIAETRHFRRAAERVNTTQSTLSSQLKALEERLGLKLVERSSTRVTITPAGEEILAIARRMLRDAQAIREIAKMRVTGLSGVLRLGVPPTIGPSLLPRIVPPLRRKFPQLKLYVREEPPPQLAERLEQGGYDVIITILPRAPEAAVVVELFEEALLLAVAGDHPLASKAAVMPNDLSGLDILTLRKGHQIHTVAEALCQKTGAILRDDYEGTSLDTLREMVATGLGAAFLPALYGRSRITPESNIVLRELTGHPLIRKIVLCWRPSTPQSARMHEFADVIKTAAASGPLPAHLVKNRS